MPTKYQKPGVLRPTTTMFQQWQRQMFEVSNAGALPKDGGTTCDHFGCQCLGGKIVLGTPNWMCGRGVTWEALFFMLDLFNFTFRKGFENQTSWD